MSPFRASAAFTERWQNFDVDIADGVATVTLSRPEKLNALTFDVYADLRDLLGELPHRGDTRVLVLTGQGRGFCSGGDVEAIIGELQGAPAVDLLAFTRRLIELRRSHPIFRRDWFLTGRPSRDSQLPDVWWIRQDGRRMTIRYGRRLREFCDLFGVKPGVAFEKIPADARRILLHGTTPEDEKKRGAWFEGVIPSLLHRFENTESDFIKRRILAYMSELPCPECKGRRLRPEALSVRVGEKNIDEVARMTIASALAFFAVLATRRAEASASADTQ